MVISCEPCGGTGLLGVSETSCMYCGGDGEVDLVSPEFRHIPPGPRRALWGVVLRSVLTKLDALDTKMDTLDAHLDAIETKIDALE